MPRAGSRTSCRRCSGPWACPSAGARWVAAAGAQRRRRARRRAGYDLLRRRGGHAPWLRTLFADGLRVASGFPSTTPVSMGSFGTGLAPGSHGMVGFEVLVPGEDRLLNELSWEDGPVPEHWQPRATWFEKAVAGGLDVARVGPAFFDGSGLTRAALRGGRFVVGADARRPGGRHPGARPVAAGLADLPLLGRPRQGRARPRLRVVAVGRRARDDRPGAGAAGGRPARPTAR